MLFRSYWGIFNDAREWKFDFQGPIVANPNWPWIAGATTLLAFFPMVWFLSRARDLRTAGRVLFATAIQTVVSTGAWAADVASSQYLSTGEIITWGALGLGLALLMSILLVEILELVEAFWLHLRRKPALEGASAPAPAIAPKVSVHIPICNEPPHMVIQSLEALAALD